MNLNDLKMSVKRVPVVSSLATGVFRAMRQVRGLVVGRRAANELMVMLSGLTPGVPRVWHFGSPTHPNLGDQAQMVFIREWCAENFPERSCVPITSEAFNARPRKVLRALQECIGSTDLIVMQSGYTMDGIHPDEMAHQLVPPAFPRVRIVIFPQTILYRSKRGQRRTVKALDSHRRLLLMARDEVSFASAKELFRKTHVELLPDIVTTGIGRYEFDAPRSGILVCVRNDGEKLYKTADITEMANELAALAPVSIDDTTVPADSLGGDDAAVWRKFEAVVADYSRYRLVVTDRYHGTIFSLIAGTPVIVLKTSDHKVITGAKWFEPEAADYVRVVDSLEEVPSLAQDLLDRTWSHSVEVTFPSRHYSRLRALVDSL